MAGGRQKLIKLALARDMNCGITPWIASNPISLAQLVMRNRDESSACNETQFLNLQRKKINTPNFECLSY